MMVAPVERRDRDRGAVEPKSRCQPAEAGAYDHHAMGLGRARRFGRHVEVPSVSGFSVRSIYLGIWRFQSKGLGCQALRGCCTSATRRRAGSHNPATAPSSESAAATRIAAAKPELKVAAEPTAPFAENTATRAAMPNMPPRNRPMWKTPDALPISATVTEPRIAFWAAGIAIETPTPARTSGAIRFE